MKTAMKTIHFEALNLDQRGYGIDGTLTRREWQDECARMLLAGRQAFNQWQTELRNLVASSQSNPPSFDWEERYSDSSKPNVRFGWSEPKSFFVFDVTNHVFEEQFFLLSGYAFLNGAMFNGVTFKGMTSFDNTHFEQAAFFLGAKFNGGAAFSDATFKQLVIFDHSIFEQVVFCNANSKFEAGASFKCVEFRAEAHFQGAQFGRAVFEGAHFAKKADFSGAIALNDNKLQTFGPASFLGVHFEDRSDFSNREFTGSTSFGEYEGESTRFDVAPLFHNCKLHQDTTFSDAVFPASSNSDKAAARAYNTLRLAMSQKQSTREEQRFLMLELDSERVMAKGGLRLLYESYKKFADYGFSASRPFLLLVLLPILCAILIYGFLVGWANCTSLADHSCQFDTGLFVQTLEHSLLQSLPPLGLDRTSDSLRLTLFKNNSPVFGFALMTTVIVQKFLALAGWFFVALALRNTFKMK